MQSNRKYNPVRGEPDPDPFDDPVLHPAAGDEAVTGTRVGGLAASPLFVVTASLFVLLMGSNLPTPLYLVYEARFGFSSEVLTLIFAVYAIMLIPSILLFGQLSDGLGRKPVILGGLVVAAAGLTLFAFARSTAWLFAARIVQGIAVGAASGTAIAALVEVEPQGDRRRAALAAVLGLTGGCAAGPLLAGALAEWAPAQGSLSYLVGLCATVLAGAGIRRIGEPGHPTGHWRVQRPYVPRDVRSRFARASLTGAASWAVGALFLSIVPSYTALLLASRNLALLGAVSALMLLCSCAAQAWALRSGLLPGLAEPSGLALLILGIGSLVFAFPFHSLTLVLCGAVLAGAGLGFGTFGAQAEINELAPENRRGEVTAAFLTCIYAGVALAAVATGLLSGAYSLSTAVSAIGALVAAVAIIGVLWHLDANRRTCGKVLCLSR